MFEYVDELKIKNLVKEKYPGFSESILRNSVEIIQIINDHIEKKALESEKE